MGHLQPELPEKYDSFADLYLHGQYALHGIQSVAPQEGESGKGSSSLVLSSKLLVTRLFSLKSLVTIN